MTDVLKKRYMFEITLPHTANINHTLYYPKG